MRFFRWISTKLSESDRTHRLASLLREGYARLKVEDYDKARATFLQTLEYRDELIKSGFLEYVLTALNATWVLKEEYDEGIAFFSEYIRRYGSEPGAHFGRGANLWYLGRLEEALPDYSRALELDPNHILAHCGHGQVLAEMGRHNEALEALDLALRILKAASGSDPARCEQYKPIEAFVRRGRGVAAAGLGRNELAMDEFTSSITLCPENAWVYYSRAQLYERLANPKNASADYQLALAKKGPALTPIQRQVANVRIRDLHEQR
jgi:tetratricopeptide (TPR) repeat protein